MADWHSLPFEDCIEPVVYTTKVQRKDFLDNGAYPVVSQEEAFINGFWDQEADVFKVERPLVVFGDHTRILKYIDFDFVLGADGVKVLKPAPFLHPRFFYYQLHTAKLDSLGYARHYRLLKEHRVSYPLYVEQQRIVAILDEAFEGIATAKANADKNLQNARELFTSTLADVFNTAWPLVRIEDACESIMDCVNKTAPIASEPTPYKMLRTTNVRNGLVSLASVNHVTQDVYKVWTRRQVPRRGDVILTREAPMGEVGMLDSDESVFLGQRLVSYRVDTSKLDGRFLLYALQSDPLQRQIRAKASGSTVQHMRVPDSKNLQLPLPELVEQKKAVEALDAMRELANSLLAQYARKLAALDELKKSLLHQAFSGQL